MRERTYFLASFCAPIIVPCIAFLFSRIGPVREAGVLGQSAIFMFLSGVIAGLPYLFFLTGFLFWVRNKGIDSIRKFTLVAPLYFAVIFSVCWFLFAAFGNSAPSNPFESALLTTAIYGACCIGLGYLYVAAVHLGYYILKNAGWVYVAA